MITIIVFWFGLSIVVAVGANTKGRNPAGWFFLSLAISPLLAGLLLVALPSRLAARVSDSPFAAEAVRNGIAYRRIAGGQIEAMLPGGRTVFRNFAQLDAVTSGQTIEAPPIASHERYPNHHKDYRYRIESGVGVDAMGPDGQLIYFKTWNDFWRAADR